MVNLRERKRDGCLSQVIRADLPGMGIGHARFLSLVTKDRQDVRPLREMG